MYKTQNKGFARYERNGIIVLSLLIIISVITQKYIINYFAKDPYLTPNDTVKIALLQKQINEAKEVYTKNNYNAHSNNILDKPTSNSTYSKSYEKKDYYDFKIEINSATAADFERLYGIGKVYAARIVTFRDKLGGFYSIEQLKDVYGIEDSVYQKFKKNLTIKSAKVHKININTATFEELTANPYFFSTIAKQIIGYRTKVKAFATIEDVKNLYFVRDHPEQYNKMLPYIAIN